MGEVYRARDKRLNRDVAIKVLGEGLARDQDRRARFEREARAVAALNHPNIVSLFDIGTEGDILYTVSELVDGESLRARYAGDRSRFARSLISRFRWPMGWLPHILPVSRTVI
jgi:serine/threonine protein kinase